jgi:hypothetical protein
VFILKAVTAKILCFERALLGFVVPPLGCRFRANGIDTAEFGLPVVEAERDADVIADAGEGLEEERSGVDEGVKEFGRDATGDGVFGEAGDEGVDVGGGAEFSCWAKEVGGELSVENLLVEEAAFAVCVKDTEIFVIMGARHATGAAVSKRELAENSKSFAGFHRCPNFRILQLRSG